MTSPPDSAAQHQQVAQTAITSLLVANMAKVWPLIDLQNLNGSLPQYRVAVSALTMKFGQVSASQAARYYTAARATAGVGGRFIVHGAQPAGIEQVSKSLDWATKGLWSAIPDIEAAKTLTNGVAQKMVTDVGRNTLIAAIEADRKCRGMAREAKPTACSFCALLSTRGAVYKTGSFTRSDARFTGEDSTIKVHDHCHCIPVPVFSDHYEPPAHVRAWQQLYADTPYGKNAIEARNNFRVALEQQRTGTPALV